MRLLAQFRPTLDACRSSVGFRGIAGCMLLAVLLIQSGCGKKEQESASAEPTRADLSATEILANVRDTYESAPSYSDRGEFILRYQLNGERRQENHAYELAFQRPNELHLRLFNSSLMSDGKRVAFAVNDPDTNHMDQQVVVRDAPESLDIANYYKDPILSFFSAGGTEIPLASQVNNAQVELSHPALSLLTGTAYPSWFGAAKEAKRIKDSTIEGEPHYRVEIDSPYGTYIAWIEPKQFLIRRLEFPISLLDPELSESPQVRGLEMYAELNDAEIGTSFAHDSFAFELPSSVRQVRHFVTLPEPFPSELIGRRPRPFDLPALGGSSFGDRQLNGRLTAMLWFSADPICQPIMQQFGRVRSKLQTSSTLQLVAVCTEPTESISDVELVRLVRGWGCTEAVARADQSIGLGSFDIRALPTVVVMNDQGVIQFYRTIADGKIEEELVAVLARIARGEDVAKEMRDDYQKYLDEYQQQLVQAATNAPETDPNSVSYQQVSTATQPRDLELTHAWQAGAFTSAGNILPFRRAGVARFAVLDGFRTVVELDTNGQELARIALELPEGESVTSLRHVPNHAQIEFVGTSLLGQAIWGFDEDWNVVARFPKIEEPNRHAGIRDFDVAPGPRMSELIIGYWKDKGVARISLDGTLRAINERLAQVNSIVPFQGGNGLDGYLVASNDGVLRVLDSQLQLVASPSVEGFAITHVVAANSASGDASAFRGVGLVPVDDRQTMAVGFDNSFNVAWSQTLSADVFASDIRFLIDGSIGYLDGDRAATDRSWLIARPDGTIHVIAQDGSWRDRFAVGFAPTGMALHEENGQSILLVAHELGVSAWRLGRIPSVSSRTDESSSDR